MIRKRVRAQRLESSATNLFFVSLVLNLCQQNNQGPGVSLRLYDTPHYYIQFYCHTIWLFLFFSKTTTFPYDSASSLSLSLNRTTVSHQSGSRKPQDLVSVLTALERP